MNRKEEGLKELGRKTDYKKDYAPEVLETFVNKHPGNDYWVRFNCPEFTSLCPITGQPDFAEIRCLPSFRAACRPSSCAAAGPTPSRFAYTRASPHATGASTRTLSAAFTLLTAKGHEYFLEGMDGRGGGRGPDGGGKCRGG